VPGGATPGFWRGRRPNLGGRLAPIFSLEFHNGIVGGLDWEILGAILGRFSGTGRAVLCAKHKEIKTAVDSRSISPEILHETMFREHLSGELKL
jgi:hypothetical protein